VEEAAEGVEDEFEDDGSVGFIPVSPVSASPPFPAQEAPPSTGGALSITSTPFPPSPPPSSALLLRASELAESGVSCVSVHSTRGSFLFVPRKWFEEVHTMGGGGGVGGG
jgi:hypothetical protein